MVFCLGSMLLKNSIRVVAIVILVLSITRRSEACGKSKLKELDDRTEEWSNNLKFAMDQLDYAVDKSAESKKKILEKQNQLLEIKKKGLEKRKVMVVYLGNTIDFFLKKVKSTKQYVLEEIELVQDWRSKLSELIDIMEEMPIIDWIEFDSETIEDMVGSLTDSCQRYIDRRLP